MSSKRIEVQGFSIRLDSVNENDYVSLTDIAKKGNSKNHKSVIHNWMKNSNTVEFLFTWEVIHNENLKKGMQLHTLLGRTAQNRFIMTPTKWIELTNAIGIYVKNGRGGGVYAHKDIAINFCYWISPSFQLYLIKEFQRLKKEEYDNKNLTWQLSKLTDLVDDARNILDTIPHQDPKHNRLDKSDN